MTSKPSYRDQISVELLGTRTRSFDSYFKVYDNLIARSDAYVLQIEDPGSGYPSQITHDDILVAARILRDDPSLTLDKVSTRLGTRLRHECSKQQLKMVILISIRAMLMLDCAGPWDAWQPHERFIDYVSKCFPKASGVSEPVKRAMDNKKSMKAWKLKDRSHLSFRGTDSLAHHLVLDPLHPDGPTLYLFHCTSFLKAHLDRLREESFDKEEGVMSCLKSGCLPPRLLAETLHSIQGVLFHFDDHRSGRILERLIAKGGFDQDCSRPEGYKIFDDPDSLEYLYWGERLAALHAFVLDRPPRNKFERWIKWQTSESNAFAVALLALLISIVVGLLTLGMAGVQTWIAYKAWREPVNTGSGDDTAAVLQELVGWIQRQERQ